MKIYGLLVFIVLLYSDSFAKSLIESSKELELLAGQANVYIEQLAQNKSQNINQLIKQYELVQEISHLACDRLGSRCLTMIHLHETEKEFKKRIKMLKNKRKSNKRHLDKNSVDTHTIVLQSLSCATEAAHQASNLLTTAYEKLAT